MDGNQNNSIDFSNYTGLKNPEAIIAPPPDINKKNGKSKIYAAIIAFCVLAGVVFWVIYFYQAAASIAPKGTARDAETGQVIPEK